MPILIVRATLQSDTNISHQAFPKRWRAEFAHVRRLISYHPRLNRVLRSQFLEEAATKWGLHNPSYQCAL